jgi:hypothetical protein
MLEPVIDGFLESLAKEFGKYGLTYETLYNSDLDLLSQYSQSLNLRSLFSTTDLSLLPEALVEKLKGQSYNQMLYNYSPFRRNKDRLNNINFNAVFDHTNEEGLSEFSKLKEIGNNELSFFFEALRKQPIPDEIKEPIVRDMVMGEIDLTFKVLSYNTSVIQNMQFIYVQSLQRNRTVYVDLDFGQAGVHQFEYEVEFKDIDSVGHVDFAKFGNLQELTFTVRVGGPFFSFYQYHTKYIETIALELKFSTK